MCADLGIGESVPTSVLVWLLFPFHILMDSQSVQTLYIWMATRIPLHNENTIPNVVLLSSWSQVL